MITEKHKQVLEIIAKNLEGKDINWAIVGSTSLALQGVDITPNDIDILTDKEDSFKIQECLKEYVVEPVAYKESERFISYFGKFKIEGLDVEVMGDLKNKIPDSDLWTETSRLSAKKTIDYKGLKINVINLEQEYEAYVKMDRKEKAKLIKKALQKSSAH